MNTSTTKQTRTKKGEIPKILHHKQKDLAYILLDGQKRYLGKYGSTESEVKRLRIWADYISGKYGPEPEVEFVARAVKNETTIATLVQKFLEEAKGRYQKHGRVTGSYRLFMLAAEPLLKYYGATDVNDFGPLALKNIRQRVGALRRNPR